MTESLGRSIPLTVAWVGVIVSTVGGGDDAEDAEDVSAIAAEEGTVAAGAAAVRAFIFVRGLSIKSSNGWWDLLVSNDKCSSGGLLVCAR